MIRIATYNIHACVGTDGAYLPERIKSVIRNLGADIVALQEVLSRPHAAGLKDIEEITGGLGYHTAVGGTLWRNHSEYGNVILSRFPLEEMKNHEISVPGREPRGVLEIRVRPGGHPLRFFNTHFGLKFLERHKQTDSLMRILKGCGEDKVVLAGDFNEWIPYIGSIGKLEVHFSGTKGPTYPSGRAFFPLDRIFVGKGMEIARQQIGGCELAEIASDHLPVVADLMIQPALRG